MTALANDNPALRALAAPRTVAIDLTPVLPGGHNGGAKVFALELIRELASQHPDCLFVLLTRRSSHEELAEFDRTNVRRHLTLDDTEPPPARGRTFGSLARLANRLPARVRNRLLNLAIRARSRLRRHRRGGLLRDLQADLLYCPFTAASLFEAGIPTVCTVHDLQYKTYPQFFTLQDVASRDHSFALAAEQATLIAADSDYSREVAMRHGHLEATRIRTIHLRLARRIASGPGADTTVLTRLGLAPGSYLICPANFWLHKNHEMLLTAFGMAVARLPKNARLVCTGAPGERQRWLADAALRMGLGGRVLFPGYLPNAEMGVMMQNSAGMVFPSLYEGFGLPVLEAMAAGVAVACSNRTSLPEVAGDAALLFDPRMPDQIADAICTLVNDPVRRAQLVDAGHRQATPFDDTPRMAAEYWQMFCEAMAPGVMRDSLAGSYADGWLGARVQLQTASGRERRVLRMEMHAPDWLPHARVTVRIFGRGRLVSGPAIIARGSTHLVELALPAQLRLLELQFDPAFVPARLGLGPDQRELTLMLRACTIQRASEAPISLFPRGLHS